MTNIAPERLLGEAADYIEEHGWEHPTNHRRVGPGSVCAQVAIYRAAQRHTRGRASSIADPAMHLLFKRVFGFELTDDEGEIFERIWSWNDHPDRTEAEVLAVLRGHD